MITITSKADLDQYCIEIKQFPRLAGEEEMRSLATCIVAAQEQRLPSEQAILAKHRLVEAHLGLVLSLAYHYAPWFDRLDLMDLMDLIQEGNLALLAAADRCDYCDPSKHFTPYAEAYVRKVLVNTVGKDDLIQVNINQFWYLYKHKREALQALRAIQPRSLDQEVGEDHHTLADLVEAPAVICPSPASSSSSASALSDKRALVEALLSHLSLREQQVVRLRYGLNEQDGQERSQVAVAAQLGIAQAQVNRIERGALAKLRALGMQVAPAHDTTERISKGQQRQVLLERLAQEVQAQGGSEEERLVSAYERLAAQRFTGINPFQLSKVAQVDGRTAVAFLHARLGGSPQERIAAAYAQLAAQGEHPTRERIRQLAHVDGKQITTYKQAHEIPLRLTTRRPLLGTAQERLDRALAQLEAQGEKVTKTRLEQLARVASKTSGAYLRAYRAGILARGLQA